MIASPLPSAPPPTRAAPPAPPVRAAPPPRRYDRFAPINGIIVTAYKLLGLAILTAILVGLAGYLATNLFFLFDRTWIAPEVIAPNDPRVIQVETQIAEQSALREKVLATREGLETDLRAAELGLSVEKQFQARFKDAVQGDLRARRLDLARVSSLSGEYGAAKQQIVRAGQTYADLSRGRTEALEAARLLDYDSVVAQNFQASQIAGANLSLADRKVAIDTRAADLAREASALALISAPDRVPAHARLTYDALAIDKQYELSVENGAKLYDTAVAIHEELPQADAALLDYDRALSALRASPYYRAIEEDLVAASVPYPNLPGVRPGTRLFGCDLSFLLCRKVGEVLEILPGEITLHHPLRNVELRGAMIRIAVPRNWAHEKVLFVDHAPLWL